jgi:hypothetical protein
VLSDNEIEVLASLRDMKASYKERYGELQAARSEVEYTQALVETCRQELLADFTEWKAQMRTAKEPPRGGDDAGCAFAARSNEAVASGGLHHRIQPGSQQGPGGVEVATGGSRGSTPPLASLVGSLDSGRGDPEAIAYFQAQQNSKVLGAVGLKASALKKARAESKGTFSNTERTGITQMIIRSKLDTEMRSGS